MFNEIKSTALAVEFLELNDSQMNYTKLIKLMYLFDREMLKDHNRRLTYDELVNMKHGVVLSSILNRIKSDNNTDCYWKQYISTHDYKVFLIKDRPLLLLTLDEEELSKVEILYKKYKDYNYGQMIDEVHTLVEWKKKQPNETIGNPNTDFSTLLTHLNKNEKEIEVINIREHLNNTPHSMGIIDNVQ